MLKGIDISHHQSSIDLSSINTDFVIIKATEGVGYTDECCDKFYQKAKKLGKKLGVYHFARPDLGNSAIAEADWFLKETKGYWKEAILVLDWEPKGQLGNVSWAKTWLDRVYERTGVRPLIYMSASPANSHNWKPVVDGNYGLWVASYGTNTGVPQTPPKNKYWAFYIMWQYTSKGRLSGYNKNLDLNEFYGDDLVWDKYANPELANKPSEPKPEPVEPTEPVPVEPTPIEEPKPIESTEIEPTTIEPTEPETPKENWLTRLLKAIIELIKSLFNRK